ncbi:MAG: hypothetical protein AAF560_27520 [Acidobacteriota bacterium]
MSHEILTSILKDLMDELKQRAGTKWHYELADQASVGRSLVSKYRQQRVWPEDKLDDLAGAAKLTTGQMGWLIGFLLEQRYRAHRFELLTGEREGLNSEGLDRRPLDRRPVDPRSVDRRPADRRPVASEIREPQTPYGKPTLEEQLEVAMSLDLSDLAPEDRITLSRLRATLRQIIERVLRDHSGLTQDLEAQLDAFRDSAQLARQRKPQA